MEVALGPLEELDAGFWVPTARSVWAIPRENQREVVDLSPSEKQQPGQQMEPFRQKGWAGREMPKHAN